MHEIVLKNRFHCFALSEVGEIRVFHLFSASLLKRLASESRHVYSISVGSDVLFFVINCSDWCIYMLCVLIYAIFSNLINDCQCATAATACVYLKTLLLTLNKYEQDQNFVFPEGTRILPKSLSRLCWLCCLFHIHKRLIIDHMSLRPFTYHDHELIFLKGRFCFIVSVSQNMLNK